MALLSFNCPYDEGRVVGRLRQGLPPTARSLAVVEDGRIQKKKVVVRRSKEEEGKWR